MSEGLTIVCTAAATLLGGAALFLITELAKRFLVDPLHELKKVIGDVSFWIAYYGRGFPPRTFPQDDESIPQIRKLSAELQASAVSLPWYKFCRCFVGVPARKAVIEAAYLLMQMADAAILGDVGLARRNLDEVSKLLQVDSV